MRKLHNYLSNISLFKFTIIAVVPQLILSLLVMYIINIFLPISSNFNNEATTSNMNFCTLFILVGIIGPFIETLIFQCFVISIFLCCSETKKMTIIAIICSGLIFGFLHLLNTMDSNIFWSVFYGFKSALLGIILSYTYVLYFNKTNTHTKAILATFLIHALNNLFAIAISI